MPRVLGGFQEGGHFFMDEVLLYQIPNREKGKADVWLAAPTGARSKAGHADVRENLY